MENGLKVKVITKEDHFNMLKLAAFRFDEYEKEGWLDYLDPGMRMLGLDYDIYDHGVHTYLAVFDEQENIVACQRMIRFPNTFMACGEYGGLLHPTKIKEAEKAAEVSRLAVKEEYRIKPIGNDFPMQTVHHLLAREFYEICKSEGISTIYTATLKEMTAAFKSLGFPLVEIGSVRLKNNDEIIQTKFHWSDFEELHKGDRVLRWYQAG